jgi:hypothetical protein
MSLELHRNELQTKILDLDLDQLGNDQGEANAIAFIQQYWIEALRLIENWWGAYKGWEATDTFNRAVQDNRMTMRSFGSDFERQKNKTKPVGIGDRRFYGSKWVPQLGRDNVPTGRLVRDVLNPSGHKDAYAAMNLPEHKRGIINASEYAIPENFATRKAKYDAGLHDLSVSLVVPGLDLKASSHHANEPTPHFCFLPLSKGEDQYVLYKLIRYAKALKDTIPALDTLVRGHRSNMTRVKLASDYDMGTGYSAVVTDTRPDNLPYKVTYGLGGTLKERGKYVPPITTKERLQARQQMYFKSRADIVKYGANELVIAMRKHAGPFPVYAVYDNGIFRCFKIVNGAREFNRNTISAVGVADF